MVLTLSLLLNPVALLNSATDKGKSKVLIGNFEADYSIHGLEDLHLHVNGGMDLSTGKSKQTLPTLEL